MMLRAWHGVLLLVALAAGCRKPIVSTEGFGNTGSRFDTIYVNRSGGVVPVGDTGGNNLSGAAPDEELFNAEGKPLGGQSVPAVFTGLKVAESGADLAAPNDLAAPADLSAAVDGGVDAAVPADMTGTASDGGEPDMVPPPPDLLATDGPPGDLAPSDGPVVAPFPAVSVTTPHVTFRDWTRAHVEVTVTPVGSNAYDIDAHGTNFLPDAFYSVWLAYLIANPTPNLYAYAPAGALPNNFITNDVGDFDFHRRVQQDYFTVGHVIPNAIKVGASNLNNVLLDQTVIVFEFDYHSTGQTNGNASLTLPGTPPDDVPNGMIGLRGRAGVDLHPHVSTISVPAIPRIAP